MRWSNAARDPVLCKLKARGVHAISPAISLVMVLAVFPPAFTAETGTFKIQEYRYSGLMSTTCPGASSLPWPTLNGAVLTVDGPKFQCPSLAVTGSIRIGAQSPTITGRLDSSYLYLDTPLPTELNVDLTIRNTGSAVKKASVEGWVYGFLQTPSGPIEECPYGVRGAQIESTPNGLPLQPGETKPFAFSANCQKKQIERMGNELDITYLVNLRYHQGDAFSNDPDRISIYFTFKAIYVSVNAPTTTTTTTILTH